MLTTDVCTFCQHPIPFSVSLCPHCARPARFPNVRAAEDQEEKTALAQRYQAAHDDGAKRGASSVIRNFETTADSTVAVIARPESKILELASSDHAIYATYYDLVGGRSFIPQGDKWDVFRVAAEQALFPAYKEEIRFAALATDGVGLTNYGNCFITLRDEMIAHRATVFEGNVVLRLLDTHVKDLINLPKGYRAVWGERAKLCVAKLATQLDDKTTQSQYSGILLKQGATSADDDFVEVHIWGPITIRTMAKVTVVKGLEQIRTKALRDRLNKHNVAFQIIK